MRVLSLHHLKPNPDSVGVKTSKFCKSYKETDQSFIGDMSTEEIPLEFGEPNSNEVKIENLDDDEMDEISGDTTEGRV